MNDQEKYDPWRHERLSKCIVFVAIAIVVCVIVVLVSCDAQIHVESVDAKEVGNSPTTEIPESLDFSTTEQRIDELLRLYNEIEYQKRQTAFPSKKFEGKRLQLEIMEMVRIEHERNITE